MEALVLSLRILSRSVNPDPVWVLLAIIAGGRLFGFFNMLLTAPLAAAIQVLAKHWIEVYRDFDIYRRPRDRASPPATE